MPRKHPKDDKSNNRPSFSVIQERRELRAERRRRKSPNSGVGKGFLTTSERESLEHELDNLKRINKQNPNDELNQQINNLRRELKLDKELKG